MHVMGSLLQFFTPAERRALRCQHRCSREDNLGTHGAFDLPILEPKSCKASKSRDFLLGEALAQRAENQDCPGERLSEVDSVNDTNGDLASGCGLLGFLAMWRLEPGPGPLEQLGLVDNLADRHVARSVILNEANQRFLKRSADRNFLASVRSSQGF